MGTNPDFEKGNLLKPAHTFQCPTCEELYTEQNFEKHAEPGDVIECYYCRFYFTIKPDWTTASYFPGLDDKKEER